MSRIIDFEKEFFKVAKELESKTEVRRVFVKRIQRLSEDWVINKLRRDIKGLHNI